MLRSIRANDMKSYETSLVSRKLEETIKVLTSINTIKKEPLSSGSRFHWINSSRFISSSIVLN